MRRRILGVLFAALFVALCWAPAAAQEPKPEKPGSAESVRYRRGDPPAEEGQQYNWRQMAFGGVVVLVSAACVIWIVRRQRRE